MRLKYYFLKLFLVNQFDQQKLFWHNRLFHFVKKMFFLFFRRNMTFSNFLVDLNSSSLLITLGSLAVLYLKIALFVSELNFLLSFVSELTFLLSFACLVPSFSLICILILAQCFCVGNLFSKLTFVAFSSKLQNCKSMID